MLCAQTDVNTVSALTSFSSLLKDFALMLGRIEFGHIAANVSDRFCKHACLGLWHAPFIIIIITMGHAPFIITDFYKASF